MSKQEKLGTNHGSAIQTIYKDEALALAERVVVPEAAKRRGLHDASYMFSLTLHFLEH